MLPYFPPPVWTVGPFTMSAFGLLAVAAILTGWTLTRSYAQLLGLQPDAASRFARLLVLGGFAGAAASGFSSLGAMAGAGIAGLLYLRVTGRSLRYFDAAALAFSPAMILFRAGCALAHDHPGAPSSSFLAVQFPGGPRLDMGLLEMLALIPLAGALAVLTRRGCPPAFPSGLLLASYGGIRLMLDSLRLDSPPTAAYALVGIAAGAALLSVSLVRRRRTMCPGY